MRWKGQIPANTVCQEITTIMDILPTLVKKAGGEIPDDRVIDGKDIGPLLTGKKGAKSPHEAYYYWRVNTLDAVRVGDWKFRYSSVKIKYTRAEKKLSKKEKNALKKKKLAAMKGVDKKGRIRELYNLREDIGEKNNIVDKHPEIADRLEKMMEKFSKEMRETTRPAGQATESGNFLYRVIIR